METFTVELATAEGDPYDRTLGCMIKAGSTMMLARTTRIAPNIRLGQVLLEIDRLAIAWAAPQLRDSEHVHDVWEQLERNIGFGGDPSPF